MSTTFQVQTALDFAKQMIKDMPFERVWTQVAQDSSNYIWNAAPWRWTIGSLAPITLTANAQEFTVATPPSDFLRLEKCYEADGTTLNPIKPVSTIPGTANLTRPPNYVCISAITDSTPTTIRFESLYPTIPAGRTPKFWAWYKKTAPILTDALDTPGALIMDDDYYQVFTEWVLYYAYRYADDQRAGAAQVSVSPEGARQIVYTGQLGVARAALEELRQQELVIYAFPDTPSPMKDH